MARHVYLADLFRSGGLTVIEHGDWRNTGSSRFAPTLDVEHVTVTPQRVSDWQNAELLRRGRPDLPGPLSQRGTARDGTVWLIAAGRCNHNGYGYGGNDAFGNEMFNDGYDEPITAAQYRSAVIQAALLCKYNRWDVSRVMGHKETDPKRKIDPRTIWMPRMRADVLEVITHGTGDDDMSQADIDWMKQQITDLRNILKDNGDQSVFWNTYWTRNMARGIEERLDRLEAIVGQPAPPVPPGE